MIYQGASISKDLKHHDHSIHAHHRLRINAEMITHQIQLLLYKRLDSFCMDYLVPFQLDSNMIDHQQHSNLAYY